MDPSLLFEEHYESLCRYLFRFTGDSDAAADAAQETFRRLLGQVEPPREPRAWLFTVATNVAMESSRTGRRRLRLLEANPNRAPVGDVPLGADEQVEKVETQRRVRAALAELSEKDRTALLMREEGFAQREIAEALGTTTGSVGTLLTRALDKLARKLAHAGDER